MTLEEMCLAAARYSDRYDEMEKTEDDKYEEDAQHYINVFRDAINEAYREVSRKFASPDTYTAVTVNRNKQIDLSAIEPAVYTVKEILNDTKSASIGYTFDTKYILNVQAEPNTRVSLYYHYIPEDLLNMKDSPVFTDAQVDPMIYISLAVARMWQSEKKFDYANHWMSQYYTLLRDVKNGLGDRSKRRIPRRRFR